MLARLLLFVLGCCAPVACRAPAAADSRVAPSDLDRLAGGSWSGSLTYLDYTSGRSTQLRAALEVERKPGASRVWVLKLAFADEPGADGESELVLSDDGRSLDGETVIERRELEDGLLCIVTQAEGQDDEKPATLRHVYRIGAREATAQKLVRPQGASGFFERNVYRWRR